MLPLNFDGIFLFWLENLKVHQDERAGSKDTVENMSAAQTNGGLIKKINMDSTDGNYTNTGDFEGMGNNQTNGRYKPGKSLVF